MPNKGESARHNKKGPKQLAEKGRRAKNEYRHDEEDYEEEAPIDEEEIDEEEEIEEEEIDEEQDEGNGIFEKQLVEEFQDGILARIRVKVMERVRGRPEPAALRFYRKNKDRVYPNSNKGLALIINNISFEGDQYRHGSNVDRDNIRRLLVQFGYHVYLEEDLAAQRMVACMKWFAGLHGHQNANSTFVIILSHGDEGVIYGVDGNWVSTNTLVKQMNGKYCPNMFLVQACQGGELDAGVKASGRQSTSSGNKQKGREYRDKSPCKKHSQPVIKVPTDANILVGHSVLPKFASFRNHQFGSWYMQAVCQIFSEFAKDEEITSLLERVHHFITKRVIISSLLKLSEECQ
uniref:Uncharacterized protein n=1 Tax=Globodera rostochiensis TaxID=31243 RepID=A0A914IGX8_GLORO